MYVVVADPEAQHVLHVLAPSHLHAGAGDEAQILPAAQPFRILGPDQVVTDQPLQLVLDRRPFI